MLAPTLEYINPIYNQSNYIHGWKIFIVTHIMDKKWIFLLSINRDISDKLCQCLVGFKKPSHPTGDDMIGANLENTLKSIHGNFSR